MTDVRLVRRLRDPNAVRSLLSANEHAEHTEHAEHAEHAERSVHDAPRTAG